MFPRGFCDQINLQELMNGLRTMGVELSRDEAQQLMDELDNDNDGNIS